MENKWNKFFSYFLLVLFIFSISFTHIYALTPTASTSPTNFAVWVEDDLTWVFKNDPEKTVSAITLYTAKREYEAFQVVVKAPTNQKLTATTVTITDLIGPSNAKILSNNINLYREYYVYTNGSGSTSGTNKSLGPGWYPDGLIPFVDPITRADLSGTLDASPFDVNTGENQPIYIEIFTPPDTPAGVYTGTVTVHSSAGEKSIQVNLQVWGFTLPKARSLHSYTELDYSGTRNTRTNYEILLTHRFNPVYVERTDERFLMDNYALDSVSAYNWSDSSYRHCTPITPAPDVNSVRQAATDHEQGLYLYDSYANEVWPCTAQFPIYMQWAKNLRAGGIHPDIVMYPVPELMGTAPDYTDSAGDIWSVLPKHYDAAKTNINLLLSKGIEMWSYNPLVQDSYSPKQTIDYLPINSRIMHGFINQSLGFTGTKMWRVDYWSSSPWTNKEQYGVETGEQAPGEGDITYSGDQVGLPNQIVPGMRMKWFRDGSEDYEYIQMLKNQGQKDFVLSVVHSVATDFHTWSQNKDVLYAARKALGEKLSGLSQPVLCSKKSIGDADCKGTIDLTDFEIWRKEFFVGCNESNPSVCGVDEDGDANLMDADFDSLPEPIYNNAKGVSMADFEAWRKGYF